MMGLPPECYAEIFKYTHDRTDPHAFSELCGCPACMRGALHRAVAWGIVTFAALIGAIAIWVLA